MTYREDGINDGAAAAGNDSSRNNYSQMVGMAVQVVAMAVLKTFTARLVAEIVLMAVRVWWCQWLW